MPKKKRNDMRFVHNSSTPAALDAVPARPEPARDRIAQKNLGTIQAQLIGKLGSRGYGRLLAGLKDQAVDA